MTENRVVRAEREIKASPERVWECLTNPELTERYFYGTRVRSSWKPGEPIAFERKLLGIIPFALRGSIVDVEPSRLLRYTLLHRTWLQRPRPDEHSEVTIAIEPAGNGSRVRVSDDVGPTDGMERRYARSVKGWKRILHGLAETAERPA